jgi:hypothetical protein
MWGILEFAIFIETFSLLRSQLRDNEQCHQDCRHFLWSAMRGLRDPSRTELACNSMMRASMRDRIGRCT